MRLPGRRKPPPSYPAISLRISTPDGIVVETSSDELFYRMSQGYEGHEWSGLIAGGDHGTTEFSTVPLKIEIKPIRPGDARAL